MRTAAHDVRTAHHHPVAGLSRLLRNFLRHRELADPRSAGAKSATRVNRLVVMTGHRQTSPTCRLANAVKRGRYRMLPRANLGGQGTKVIQLHAGAFTVFRA